MSRTLLYSHDPGKSDFGATSGQKETKSHLSDSSLGRMSVANELCLAAESRCRFHGITLDSISLRSLYGTLPRNRQRRRDAASARNPTTGTLLALDVGRCVRPIAQVQAYLAERKAYEIVKH